MILNHEIVDDCFMYNNFNSAGESKRLLMEYVGKEFEKYVKSFAKNTDDLEYLEKEFESVKLK